MQPEPSEEARAALRVLVIDDDKNIRVTLSVCLEGMGCEVRGVGNAEAALAALRESAFDLVFLDLRLGPGDGLDLLPLLLAESPGLMIVVVTAYATVDTAVQAVKRGAADYLPKPFTPEQIRHVVEKVATVRRTRRRMLELEQELRESVPEIDVETTSPALRGVLETIARAAPSGAPVLLRGESGTGKGVLARVLHAQSPRRGNPFVVVSCPTLSAELLASELFGHARGAFTGAVRDRAGRVELAEGGTLFLDEIAEIPPQVQAQLLRFIQEKEFERVGESRTRRADVRIVAATIATSRRRWQTVASARTSSTVWRWSRCRCLRCVSARRTSFIWRDDSCPSSAAPPEGGSRSSPRPPNGSWSATTGRGTCANSETRWSAAAFFGPPM